MVREGGFLMSSSPTKRSPRLSVKGEVVFAQEMYPLNMKVQELPRCRRAVIIKGIELKSTLMGIVKF